MRIRFFDNIAEALAGQKPGTCTKFRHGPNQRFDDLDYFCQAYKMIYARSAGPLTGEVRKLAARPH
jgi:hypothetical protein